MIRAFFDRLESWVMDDENGFISLSKFMLVFGVAIIIVLTPIFWLASRGENDAYTRCLESGHGWAITGHHWGGKTMVADYGCFNITERVQ